MNFKNHASDAPIDDGHHCRSVDDFIPFPHQIEQNYSSSDLWLCCFRHSGLFHRLSRFRATCSPILDDAQKISQQYDDGHLTNGRYKYGCLFFHLRSKILLGGLALSVYRNGLIWNAIIGLFSPFRSRS